MRNLEKVQREIDRQKVSADDIEEFICQYAGGFETYKEYDQFMDSLSDEEYQDLKTAYSNAHMGFMDFQYKKAGMKEKPSEIIQSKVKESYQQIVSKNLNKKEREKTKA